MYVRPFLRILFFPQPLRGSSRTQLTAPKQIVNKSRDHFLPSFPRCLGLSFFPPSGILDDILERNSRCSSHFLSLSTTSLCFHHFVIGTPLIPLAPLSRFLYFLFTSTVINVPHYPSLSLSLSLSFSLCFSRLDPVLSIESPGGVIAPGTRGRHPTLNRTACRLSFALIIRENELSNHRETCDILVKKIQLGVRSNKTLYYPR